MHFICYMTPQPDVKILKLLQVQTSIHSFCARSCVEREVVADRLQEIWTTKQCIIEFWNKLPKYKQPSCKSFDNVKKAVTDPLSEAKISCFSFIFFLAEPYLKKFQTDNPMVSFIYT